VTDQVVQPGTNTTDPGTVTPPKLSAEEKKAQILESFESRIDSGELTLEEVENKQPWVAEAIKSKREPKVEVPTESFTKLKGDLKAELKEELTVENEFDLIKRNFPGSYKDVTGTFEQYKGSLGTKEALSLAKRLAGVDTSSESLRRQGMRLRELGEGVLDDETQVTAEDRAIAKEYGSDPKKVAQRRTILEKGGKLVLTN
jgi:hypothetical protein